MKSQKSSEQVNSLGGAIALGVALKTAWTSASWAKRKVKDAKMVSKINNTLYGEKDNTIKELSNLNITGEDVTKKYGFEEDAFYDDAIKPHIKYIKNIVKALHKTEEGKELLDIAKEEGTVFSSMKSLMMGGALSPSENKIMINRGVGLKGAIPSFAHELNHNKQFNRDFDDLLEANPHEALFVHKALEADSVAKQISISWDLKEKGVPEFFEAGAKTPYKKAYLAFEEKAKNKGNIINGEAKRAAFEGWFESKKVVGAYEQQFLQILSAEDPKILNARGIKKLNGENENQSVKKLIENMGKMPNGVNYLTNTQKGCPTKDQSKFRPANKELSLKLNMKTNDIRGEELNINVQQIRDRLSSDFNKLKKSR